MANPTNDDVIQLLSATGTRSSSYQSFSSAGQNGSSTLANAVFGTPKAPTPAAAVPLAPSCPEVAPGLSLGSSAAPATSRRQATREAGAGRRSLADLIRVLEAPARQRPNEPSVDGLQGLFKRLDK